MVGPQEILGLSATLSGEPYDSTAETVTDCEVGFVGREEFLRFLYEHNEAAFRVVECLSHNVRAAFERVRSARPSRRRKRS